VWEGEEGGRTEVLGLAELVEGVEVGVEVVEVVGIGRVALLFACTDMPLLERPPSTHWWRIKQAVCDIPLSTRWAPECSHTNAARAARGTNTNRSESSVTEMKKMTLERCCLSNEEGAYLAFVVDAINADHLLKELVEGGVGRRIAGDLEQGSEDVVEQVLERLQVGCGRLPEDLVQSRDLDEPPITHAHTR